MFNLKIICSAIYGRGLLKKVNVWSYIMHTFLRIKMVECRECSKTFSESPRYRISVISVKRFMGYMEKSVLRPYVLQVLLQDQYGRKVELSSILNFNKTGSAA
jgi:hypothetical protein